MYSSPPGTRPVPIGPGSRGFVIPSLWACQCHLEEDPMMAFFCSYVSSNETLSLQTTEVWCPKRYYCKRITSTAILHEVSG